MCREGLLAWVGGPSARSDEWRYCGRVTLPLAAAIARRPSLARRPIVLLLGLAMLALLLPASTAQAATSYDLEARYEVDLHLDWDTRRVSVKTTIDLDNTSGGPVDRLELNAAPAKLGNLKNLRVKVDGERVPASTTGQTIKVPLGSTLAEGEAAKVRVSYRARLGTSAVGRGYFFAKLGGVAQLYRFIPWLSRRIPFGSGNHGEPFLTPVSPYVSVTVSADRKLVWATSGRRVAKLGPRSFRYVARNVRDFNVAASPGWRTTRGTSRDGRVAILAHTRRHDGRRLVRLAREELARYAAITGVAYPHDTYRIAESGGGLAMESPAMIWIPASRAAYDHPYLVSHETAHQWWYSTVGNDQSRSAFADEALADYFSRKARLSLRSSRCSKDRLDREIRSYSEACYFEVVYIQGSNFLNSLRKDHGSARFKAAIREYTQEFRHDIGSNRQLLEALRASLGDGVLKRYRSRFPSLY